MKIKISPPTSALEMGSTEDRHIISQMLFYKIEITDKYKSTMCRLKCNIEPFGKELVKIKSSYQFYNAYKFKFERMIEDIYAQYCKEGKKRA